MKNPNSLKILVTIIFLVLLVTPFVLKKLYDRDRAAKLVTEPSAAMSRYGFRFEEVAKASGIDFTHQAPTLDPKLNHIMPQVASMGAAVSVVDYDRDGWQDLYVTNSGEGSMNRLYHNLGDGSFKDVAAELGVGDLNRLGREYRWARSGEITTTTVSKTCSCINGAARSYSITTRDEASHRVTETAGLPVVGERKHGDLVRL